MRTEIRNKIVCKRRTLAKRWFLATFVRTAWLHRIKWKYTMNFLLTQKNLMLSFCGKGSPLNLCSLNTLRDFIGISLGFHWDSSRDNQCIVWIWMICNLIHTLFSAHTAFQKAVGWAEQLNTSSFCMFWAIWLAPHMLSNVVSSTVVRFMEDSRYNPSRELAK